LSSRTIQIGGFVASLLYASFIVWLYATEPRTFRDLSTKVQVTAGTYEVDQTKFLSGLELFRREQFPAAREQWQQADPADGDAKTQFYIAYSLYREGWGRVYYDKELLKQALAHVEKSIALGPVTVDDPDLQLKTPIELKAELQQDLETKWSDVNPLKILRTRK
jgi:tetratricopeptide (TPR) repeat protein